MSREVEAFNRRLLRARDAMDRAYAEPLNVRAVAAVAHLSEAHFIRSFRAVFGETPHRYLQRRRVERSMFLLRETDRSVTDKSRNVPTRAPAAGSARNGSIAGLIKGTTVAVRCPGSPDGQSTAWANLR